MLQNLRLPGYSEVPGARAEQVDFYFPGVYCAILMELHGMRKGEADYITAPYIHREHSTLRVDKENQEGEEGKLRYIMPRGVKLSFTGGRESLRRDKLLASREER